MLRAPGHITDVPLLDGMKVAVAIIDETEFGAYSRRRRRDLFGRGNIGHLHLVFEADFVGVKTGLHVVDGLAVLDGDHATSAKTSSVADAVDLIKGGRARIAGT